MFPFNLIGNKCSAWSMENSFNKILINSARWSFPLRFCLVKLSPAATLWILFSVTSRTHPLEASAFILIKRVLKSMWSLDWVNESINYGKGLHWVFLGWWMNWGKVSQIAKANRKNSKNEGIRTGVFQNSASGVDPSKPMAKSKSCVECKKGFTTSLESKILYFRII